jgi:hypothetical protein
MSPEYDRITWEEVSKAASKMFNVWFGDGEIKWVEECWRHFGEAGLTGISTPLEATATLLRLVTLARVYEEFCGLAWDENPETPIHYLAEDLKLDALALGILGAVASPEVFDNAQDEYELREAALAAATEAQRQEIFDCLVKAYGSDIQLYSRMSQTNKQDQTESDYSEFEVIGPNALALSFVIKGFQQG